MRLFIAFVFLCLLCSVQAKCAMRGECAMVGSNPKPCPVDHDAMPLTEGIEEEEEAERIRAIFAHRCPWLAYDYHGNLKPFNEILTCCDAIQVERMSESLLMAEGVLGRCPMCLRNFARQICEMNCSPNQAQFLDVEVATSADNETYVNEINYRVCGDFMDDAHVSCSGVIVPQTGLPAINIMCGNAVECDADAWFGYTGDTSQNPFAPVQVNFLRWNTTEDSMCVRAPPCNETLPGGDLPCNCIDCIATCPFGNEPIVPELCTVIGVHCAGFSVAIVFFVISVTFFIILTILDYKKTRNVKSKPDSVQNINFFTRLFQASFAKLGVFSACYPAVIIMFTSWLVFAMFFGVLNINLTSDPLELWSAPDSRSRAELNYFNSRFGPFYRAAQVFLTIDLDPFIAPNNQTYGPAFRIEAIEQLIKLENAILNIGRDNDGVTLEQVCYAPNKAVNAPPDIEMCVLMSVSVYLGSQRDDINNVTYINNIQNCLNNHYNFDCLASWGGGSEPEITFGGYEDDIRTANTLLINFPISNYLLEEDLRPVLEWEQSFIDLLHDYEENWKADFVDVAFGTERSIEDEIERVALAEAVPIMLSYLIMFIYVIVALGNIRTCKTWFVDSKIMIAVGSFITVIVAIFCAMGVMGYFRMTITLLAINVIPFFILSVGIDNVFLMVNTLQHIQSNLKEFEDYNENFSYTKKRNFIFEKMLGRVGPSMFVSSVTQITCFGIGALANFPAVVTFAVFAAISLGFLFVFQVTTIVALLSIDYKRASQNRFDVLCCIRKKILDSDIPYRSVTQKLMEPYTKFILNWKVKICVAILFMTMASVSVVFIPQIEVGLDQEMALPLDSYVYKYLQAVNSLMHIGPPVYFVLKSGLNFTDIEHQNVICGTQLCNEDSLATQIFLASLHPEITYIARSSNSWLDDFIEWSALYGSCCKYNTTDGGFCQSLDVSPECSYCIIDRNDWSNGLRPSPSAFEQYIPFFLQDTPSEMCNKGGLASYSSAVNYVLDSEGRATVQDTNFMAYHSSLGTSKDYITAVEYAYIISENITKSIQEYTGTDVEVFPYSVFFVYYEQYLTMWSDTFASIGFCMIGAVVFNLLASGFNLTTTITVMFTVLLVVVNMMGVMYLWNIPLNAVSNINLIVSIGISVEFCSHIAYAFNISKRPPRERVEDALLTVGPTIITGITFTNIPIIVLAFSYTEIIEVFFFRMFFSLVVLGFLHGMIFYPVFLSYVANLRFK